MHPEAERLIIALELGRHPEGGWYRETWRSDLRVATRLGERAAATSIHYLLADHDVSRLHRLKADEIFHLYAGGPLAIHILTGGEGYRKIILGPEVDRGQVFQAVIPAGCWFGASLVDADSFALVGCTVAPGFDFDDFEMGDRAALLAEFPDHEDTIRLLT